MSILVDPKRIPDEGLTLQGELPCSVFLLDSKDSTQAESPLFYDLTVLRDEDCLILTGRLSTIFQLQCGRCAENYHTEIVLQPYGQDIELENDQAIDLTNTLREDILLALPNYPRCETANVSPRECPAQDRFAFHQEPLPDDAESPNQGTVWEALDQFNNPKQR